MKERFAKCGSCGHIGRVPQSANFEKDSIHCPQCNSYTKLLEVEIVRTAEAKETPGYYTPWHAMRDQLVDQFGDELGRWLARRVGKAWKKINDPCKDNFCIVELPTKARHYINPLFMASVKRHYEKAEGGCCGRYDETVEHHRTGRKFTFGFNYGH